MRALSYIGVEKITFPLKPDIQTDWHTDIHSYRGTDISVYRVASLLKNKTFITIVGNLLKHLFNKSTSYHENVN